jgi:type IV pilus assembly protein PilN
MIRINLLSEGRRPVAAKQPKLRGLGAGGFDPANVWLIAVAVIGILFALGHNFVLGRALEGKKAEVAEAQREVDELEPILKEVEDFKAKRAELESKIQVINDLKANQPGPVKIMDYVSKALPELLWLQKMTVKDPKITVSGEAFNTNAVANFIENLDIVPGFAEPVLKDTSRRGPVYSFVIEFEYSFTSPASDDEDDGVTAAGQS